MTSLTEIRSKYPQYEDLSDDQLLRGLHAKHYSDLDYEVFRSKITGSGDAAADAVPAVSSSGGERDQLGDSVLSDGDSASRGSDLSNQEVAPQTIKRGKSSDGDLIFTITGSPLLATIAGTRETLGNAVNSVLEPAVTMATGAGAEVAAGVAGIGAGAVTRDSSSASNAVGATREALTYQPRSEGGQAGLEAIADTLEPAIDAFKGLEGTLGETVYEKTGSPALAAAAASSPTFALEMIGLGLAKGGVKSASKAKRASTDKAVDVDLTEGVPSVKQLKATSRAVYKEIDDLGATMRPKIYQQFTSKLKSEVKRMGVDPDVTPKAWKALKRFEELNGTSPSLTDIDTLRKIAQNAADSIDGPEKAIGSAMVASVDDFLDNIKPHYLQGGKKADIGARYKVARDLWGRAKRSQMIGDAIETARNTASGFENGIRIELRKILRHKKNRRFFKPGEMEAIRQVVEGTKGANMAKLFGRFAFNEGSATNIIGGSISTGTGAAVGSAFGPAGSAAGAILLPVIGHVSRQFAQRLTKGNAEFADQVIRAGSDARKIAEVYRNNTPPELRSPEELSSLLMRRDIDTSSLDDLEFARQAAQMAKERQAALAGASIPASSKEAVNQ